MRAGRRTPFWLAASLALAPRQAVDSIFTPQVELARFRATIPGPAPVGFEGASSPAELVRRFVAAVEKQDTAALGRLLISKAEFGFLYFPSSDYNRPPYRQKPGLVWFRMTETSQKGIGRALARDGGKSLQSVGHRCPKPAKAEGPHRVWTDCRLLVRRAGRTIERRLFGSIVERSGRYKFLTYASEY